MQLIVTTFAAAHLPAVAELEQLCFSEPWSEAGLAAELENPAARFRVAVDEQGEVLGYLGVHCAAGECYIDNVAVFPHARRLGVGNALLADLVDWAKAEACAFVTLEVRPSNTAAIALYESFGFAQAGLRRRFYRNPDEDGLILTLTL